MMMIYRKDKTSTKHSIGIQYSEMVIFIIAIDIFPPTAIFQALGSVYFQHLQYSGKSYLINEM